MTQDLAIKKQTDLDTEALFDAVRTILSEVEPQSDFIDKTALFPLCEELEKSFAKDWAEVTDISGVLFDPDITAYGARTANIFSRWDAGESPSLLALTAAALVFFDIPFSSPLARAGFVSSVLAEIPSTLQYHGNDHYRKVLFHAIRLMALHNQIFQGSDRAFTKEQIGTLLIASCIHDLGHEGGDNLRDGVYTPGYMEQKAVDIAKPYLKKAELEEELIGEIETLVFSTDITFFAGDNSPCVRLKKIYRHYFEDSGEDISLLTMGKLRRYDENPALVEMAMLLHEADIGSSAGLSYEQTIKETVNIIEERGLKTAGPKTVLAFLREQLGETLATEAGRKLFGPVMAIVIEEAEKDILSGRETYYD